MSRNSAINFTADSERISMDFINDIISVVRNYNIRSRTSAFRAFCEHVPRHPAPPILAVLVEETWSCAISALGTQKSVQAWDMGDIW